MLPSEIYYKKAKDVIRTQPNADSERIAADLRDVLFHTLKDLPDSLQHDIFNFYYDEFLDDPNPDKSLYDLAEKPCQIIDFLTGHLRGDAPEFSDDEWEMIREGINAAADSMDLELLNQLMGVLVEKKRY